MLKRVLLAVVAGALFIAGIQYTPVLYTVWEFHDFVRDEVRFAPIRERDDREHLVLHIMDQARRYRLNLNEKDVQVTKTRDAARGITTLSVDLDYRAPVDLYYFTHEPRFRFHTSTTY